MWPQERHRTDAKNTFLILTGPRLTGVMKGPLEGAPWEPVQLGRSGAEESQDLEGQGGSGQSTQQKVPEGFISVFGCH